MTTRVVVTGWVGTGTRADPYRPDVDPVNSLRHGAIKLRGHPAVNSDALCLVVLDYPAASRVPTRRPGSPVDRLRDLGQDTEAAQLSTATTAAIAADLGVVAPSRATIGELCVLALGSQLRRQRNGMLTVEINGHLLHQQAAVQGGATDPFTYSNGALPTVSGGLWTTVTGSGSALNVLSNSVSGTGAISGTAAWTATFGTDHFSEADLTSVGNATESYVSVRQSTAAETGYYGALQTNATTQAVIFEATAGSFAVLATSGATTAGLFRMEAEGSALRLYRNDSLLLSTTDGTIASNTRVGIAAFLSGGTSYSVDNWRGGDLFVDMGVSGGGRRFFRPGRGPKPRWVRHWDNHEWSSGAFDVAAVTDAPAEHAAATGTAGSATVAIAPNAGHAAATGTASPAQVSIKPSAGHAAGTGAASSATVSVAPSAGHAAGTGSAHNATAATFVAPVAGHAAGTGAANAATVKIAPTAGHAAGSGAANAASSKVSPTAGHAAGGGSANDATVATGTFAVAGHAAGTGAAQNATVAVAPTAGHAAGTGAAGVATAKVAPTAGHAAATGAAHTATAKVAPTAGHAAGTGTAFDATVITGSFTYANAGHAAGTGTANGATVKVSPQAGTAAGTGAAFDATVVTGSFTNADAGHASGTGTANAATVRIAPTAGHAAGTAIAAAATATIKPTAGHASGIGAAFAATVIAVNGGTIIGGHGVGAVIWRDGGVGTITASNGSGGVVWRDDADTLVAAGSGSGLVGAAHTGTGTVQPP